jgi:hypothetical protein
MKRRLPAALRLLSWGLFVVFLFYWFKDNIPALKCVPGRPFIPFLLLAAIVCVRIILAWRNKTFRLRLRPNRTTCILAGLILLAVVVRIPYFIYGSGILSSDDAIPALMGKHIAEGKVPPISYYGQLYMGSATSHAFGLAFKILGYSIPVLLTMTLLFYLGFLVVQFFFLKEVFSPPFAAIVGLFYALPLGHLMRISLGETAAFPLVLLFGAVLFYLSYRIAWKGEERWLSLFGCISGLAFWTHQGTLAGIAVAWLAVLARLKPGLKRYATLLLSSLVGLFPLLMQEVHAHFQMVEFLIAGDKRAPSGVKLIETARFMRGLLSSSAFPLTYVFVVMVFVGGVLLGYQALRRRDWQPRGLYPLYFVLFFASYLFSGFSNRSAVRYLFPSYLCLPILLFGGVWFLLRRRRLVVSLTILVILMAFNWKGDVAAYGLIRGRSLQIRSVLSAMEATGVKYWQAEYWTAYLLTAVAGEKVVIDAYTVDRYVPYRLDYFNRGRRGAFVFMKDSTEAAKGAVLVELLKSLGVPFRLKDVDGSRLVFGLENQVFTPTFFGGFVKEKPPRLPALRLEESATAKGYLRLSFSTEGGVEPGPGFQVWAGIPPYGAQARNLGTRPEDNRFRLPLPRAADARVEYGLSFCGLKIPASVRTLPLRLNSPADARRKDRFVFLSGLGPRTTFFGKEMKVLEKEVRIEVNRLKKRKTRLRLDLYSPFDFEHTFWYGDYAQRLTVLVNGMPCAVRTLRDKENSLEIEVEAGRIRPGRNLVTLKFDYQLPLIFAPFNLTACLLETINVGQGTS